MNGRVRIIVAKEWAELMHRRGMLLLMTVLPTGLLIVATAAALIIPGLMSDRRAFDDPDVARVFAMIQVYAPDLAALGPKLVFQVLLLRQIVLLLLLCPIVVAMSMAAYSIVGEKVNRSLEPLLATPITTTELLLGKSLASVIPGIGLTWVLFGLFALAVVLFGPPSVPDQVLDATALGIILVLCPLITLLALSVVIIMSARSSDPRSAQQIGAVVVVPLVCVVVGQMSGLFLLTPLLTMAAALVLAVVDYFTLKVGVALFQRETILTRWK